MKIHNCLLCHGEDRFNLISVSQMLRTRQNEVTFSAEESRIKMTKEHMFTVIGLNENEGLYELEVSPLYADDDRTNTLPSWNLTLEEDPLLWQESAKKQEGTRMKAPTKLGVCGIARYSR